MNGKCILPLILVNVFALDIVIIVNMIFLVIYTAFITGQYVAHNVCTVILHANPLFSCAAESEAPDRFKQINIVLPLSFLFLLG